MSRTSISLRISGERLPSDRELKEILGIAPTEIWRKGEQRWKGTQPSKWRIQPQDVCVLELRERSEDTPEEQFQEQLLNIAKTLHTMTKVLKALDRNAYAVDLFVSIIQEQDMGGFCLPEPLVSAASAAGMDIEVSTLFILDDYDERE